MATVETDQDLLFGILALQNSLIEQPDLIAAFQCWLKERPRSMGRILVERGVLTEEDRSMLESLVRRHLEKRSGASRDGDQEESLPELSFRDNGDPSGTGNLTIGVGVGGAVEPDPLEPLDWSFNLGQATSAGGRFRLLRHHARGGIGVVFVALDSELHREVALKQIQPQHADDPSSRARFLIEAEVTGRLEHPGVVPVYGLGSNEEGRPFYAMRFVRGQSLKEAIEKFHRPAATSSHSSLAEKGRAEGAEAGPEAAADGSRDLALRQLLRRFIDVCNAIAYAHSRGVIHRDLKPANILLGPYGETLVVDWGLAKVVGRDDPTPQPAAEMTLRPSSRSGSGETQAGTAVGTPAYMSPEQSEGRLAQIGPASDTYSLGATLYCILTGQPPLGDGDLDDLLMRLRRGDIDLPRQVNPRVPPALEAIVLKAMAVRPADRYSSAHALAEDIERWLADEPIVARREPFKERARRWMRRHRTAVAAIATALVAATLGLAAVLVVQTQANVNLKSANFDLALANQRAGAANRELVLANQRERARFDLALEAIKTFHSGVSEDVLLKEKQFDGLRTKLLRGATEFYQRMEHLLKEQADPRSRSALAQAYHDIGELTARIGSQTEALRALRRGLELRLSLAAEPGAGDTTRRETGSSLLAVADLQVATGDLAGAFASYERAREFLEPLARTKPVDAISSSAVAKCLHGIATVQYHTGHAAEALASHEQARAIRQRLTVANPAVTQFQNDLAASYHDIGSIHRASGRATEALESYARARAISQKLADIDPSDTQFQSALAQSHNDIAYVYQETGRLAEALASLEQGRAILQKLADANPAVTRFEGDLAQTHQVIGAIQDETGHPALALVSFERARAILQKLNDANPTLTLYQNRLAMSHSYVGLARRRSGRPFEAAVEFRRAVAIMEHLAVLQPDGYNLYNLACFRSLLSGIAAEPGSGMTAAEAASLGEKAVETLRRAVAAGLQDAAFMRRDADLDPLRSRPDFQMFMMDLAFPDEPFAP